MSTSRQPKSAPTYVTVVSDNPETLDSLQRYLEQAGVASHCTRAVHDLGMVAPPFATATVIFPDDFTEDTVLSLVSALRRERPRLLTLLITRTPHRYRSVLSPDSRSISPIVLPKPSFGWDILDAIRGHSADPLP
jgi:hypothetical protein